MSTHRVLLLAFASSLLLFCATASAQTAAVPDSQTGDPPQRPDSDPGTPAEEIVLRAPAAAQTADVPASQTGEPSQRPDSDLGTPGEEILLRARIKHEEDSHKEIVERAGEMAQMGGEILDSFNKTQSLSSEDLKKLDRMEKLARKIRSNAGASDDIEESGDSPGQLSAAVKRLAEVSDTLNKNVQKTSRLVISAAVIKNSNELIGLIRRIKNIPRP